MNFSAADTYWAAFLGCDEEHLDSPDIVLVPHFVEHEYEGYYVFTRGTGCVVTIFSQAPAELYKRLEAKVPGRSPREVTSRDFWENEFRGEYKRVMGPAMIAYVDADRFHPSEPRVTRQLLPGDRGDAESLRRLFGACTVEEWDHSGIQFEHEHIVGAFAGERLVAAASYERWSREIAHIGVAVASEHRGEGYGLSVVSALTRHCLAEGLVPQYRTLLSNAKSVSLSHRLGFIEYARTLSITVRDSD